MISKLSGDYGASLYIDETGNAPDFDALYLDGRIRDTYNRDDWSAGDYTYSEDDHTLRLTGNGAPLWRWIEHKPLSVWDMGWDRIGMCEVLWLLGCDYGLYGVLSRLTDRGLTLGHDLVLEDMDEWQQQLYADLEDRAAATGPMDKFLKKVR